MQKAYEDKDGNYYIEFALSTTDIDLEKEQMTEKAIDSMVEQAKNINSFEAHQYGLNDVIGPVVDAWKSKNKELWVKVLVIPSMASKIKELVDNGVRLGGSIGGLYVKDFMERGVRKIDEVLLLDATLTPLPVNFQTLGTARSASKTCKNNICRQIMKSIDEKYFKKNETGGVNIPKNKKDSMEELQDNLRVAVQEKFNKEDPWDVWIKLTFTDSVIVKVYENGEDKLYEIPYTTSEDNTIELGEAIEVEEQYVAKRMEVLNIKEFNVDEDYLQSDAYKEFVEKEFKEDKGGNIMKEELKKELTVFGEAMGKTIVEGLKEAIKPPEAEDLENVKVKSIDKEELAEEITQNVIKALGIEMETESQEESDSKIVIMDSKAFHESQEDLIKKTVLELGKSNPGQRKSNPLGNPKFVDETAPSEPSADKPVNKSIRQMAEESVNKNPLVKALQK